MAGQEKISSDWARAPAARTRLSPASLHLRGLVSTFKTAFQFKPKTLEMTLTPTLS